jgi:hypothetical protein
VVTDGASSSSRRRRSVTLNVASASGSAIPPSLAYAETPAV